jgi:hypothetical protein
MGSPWPRRVSRPGPPTEDGGGGCAAPTARSRAARGRCCRHRRARALTVRCRHRNETCNDCASRDVGVGDDHRGQTTFERLECESRAVASPRCGCELDVDHAGRTSWINSGSDIRSASTALIGFPSLRWITSCGARRVVADRSRAYGSAACYSWDRPGHEFELRTS